MRLVVFVVLPCVEVNEALLGKGSTILYFLSMVLLIYARDSSVNAASN